LGGEVGVGVGEAAMAGAEVEVVVVVEVGAVVEVLAPVAGEFWARVGLLLTRL
jgi:hypothetical protein